MSADAPRLRPGEDGADAPWADEVPGEEIPPEVEARIEEVADEFLDALRAGPTPDPAEWAARRSELGPWLARRLAVVAWMHDVGRSASASACLRCPSCGNDVPNAGGPGGVVCSNCGSVLRVDLGLGGGLASPERIGRFRTIALVGRGAFGAVFQAWDPELHRVVAVKIPRSGFFATPGDEERFLREARNAAALRHPSIVPVHEIGREGGLPYIVSEFIEGSTLADLMAARPPGFREAASIVARVAEALACAHASGVIHRDVKPQNILLDRAGIPHVTDFGLARRDEGELTVTLDGQILGTPAYMSPEQAAGDHERVEARTDVYALGVVLYELLTGQRPFQGSRTRVLHQVIHDEPRVPRMLNDHVPRDLETVCLQAMAKEPHRRYSALEFAADLGRWLRGEPVRARPAGPAGRAWRWARRRPAIATLASLVAILLLSVVAVSASMALQFARSRDLVEDQLARLDVRTAFRLVSEEDYLGALPWLAEAYRLDGGNEAREATHLRQFESVLARAPKLSHVWFRPPSMYYLDVNAEGSAVALLSGGRAWVAATGGEPRILDTSTPVRFLAFSPDGARLATAGVDGAIDVFDAATADRIAGPFRHGGPLRRLAFSPDGEILAAGGNDHRIGFWNSRTGERAGPVLRHSGAVLWVEFHPDGRRLASASSDGTGRIWDWRSGKLAVPALRHERDVERISLSPDGRRAATASLDGTARVWDVETGEALGPPLEHRNRVNRAVFSPDGRLLLTASHDGNAAIWNLSRPGDIPFILEHSLGVPDAVFSADGRRVATASYDGTARLWDAATGRAVLPPLYHGGAVLQVRLSPDGRRATTSSADGTAREWDLAGTGAALPFGRHQGLVQTAEPSRDGTRWLAAGLDGRVSVWSLPSGAFEHDRISHSDPILHASFSPDGRAVATGSRDRTARVWRAEDGLPITPPLAHAADVVHVIFSPDGRCLLASSLDGSATLWNAGTGEPLFVVSGHEKGLASSAFAPDGRRFATAGLDGAVCLWDSWTGSAVLPPIRTSAALIRVVFSPDGRLLATAAWDGTGRIWDAETGAELGGPLVHTSEVDWIAFHSDSRRVLTGSHDGIARIWDARTGQPLVPDFRHRGAVLHGDFSPDGTSVVTAGWDGEARIWDTSTGEELAPPLEAGGPLVRAWFRPDGCSIVTAARDGSFRVWTPWRGAVAGADLGDLASVLAARTLDASGGQVRLEAEEFRGRWERLRAKYPDVFQPSAEELAAWRALEAEACEDARLWTRALEHLDGLVRERPRDAGLLLRRARLLSRFDRSSDAVRDYREAFALGLASESAVRELSLVLLAAGDAEAYREEVRRLLEGAVGTLDAARAQRAAWASLLVPDALDDPPWVEALLHHAIEAEPRNPALRTAQALYFYRVGRLDQAIRAAHGAIASGGNVGGPRDWLILAMVHHRRGESAEASHWLDRAIVEIARGSGAEGVASDWFEDFELDLLIREAASTSSTDADGARATER